MCRINIKLNSLDYAELQVEWWECSFSFVIYHIEHVLRTGEDLYFGKGLQHLHFLFLFLFLFFYSSSFLFPVSFFKIQSVIHIKISYSSLIFCKWNSYSIFYFILLTHLTHHFGIISTYFICSIYSLLWGGEVLYIQTRFVLLYQRGVSYKNQS